MGSGKECDTPIVIGKCLSKQDSTLFGGWELYRSIVSRLQYCILTRSDISFIVNKLFQSMSVHVVYY